MAAASESVPVPLRALSGGVLFKRDRGLHALVSVTCCEFVDAEFLDIRSEP